MVRAHTMDLRRPFLCQPCPARQLLSASEIPRERRITVGLRPLNLPGRQSGTWRLRWPWRQWQRRPLRSVAPRPFLRNPGRGSQTGRKGAVRCRSAHQPRPFASGHAHRGLQPPLPRPHVTPATGLKRSLRPTATNSPPSCLAAFPFSCAQDLGPPAAEFVPCGRREDQTGQVRPGPARPRMQFVWPAGVTPRKGDGSCTIAVVYRSGISLYRDENITNKNKH